MNRLNKVFSNLSHDLPASVVVFLVALPLCLGIAVASDAHPFTGIIAGIVGGIVVGAISGSAISVSGPAAGLATIVAAALAKLPSYDVFILAVVIAGVIQIALGLLRAGAIARYIPNVVIKGMLAAIGIMLILKQLPHFVGYDKDPEGEEAFFQVDGENTFSEIILALNMISPWAILIAVVSSIILLVYGMKSLKEKKFFQYVPGPLMVVIVAVVINEYLFPSSHTLSLRNEHLVQLPVFTGPAELWAVLPSPQWGEILNGRLWVTALTIAVIASLESLLSLEAADKLDDLKRISPTNRELIAQGSGNIVSGLLGGLPVTSVIVRSSANANAGARTKMSTIFHGLLLMLTVLLIPELLNKIPKSALAAILIFIGYKLANVDLFYSYYKKGFDQFLPFVITILAILFTDLLIGIMIGLLAGLFFVFRSNFRSALAITIDDNRYLIRFGKEVSFLNKPLLLDHLESIPDGAAVLVDATRCDFIDRDVIDSVNDFIVGSAVRDIKVYIKREHSDQKEIFIDPYRHEIK